jgi:hypothetical protein
MILKILSIVFGLVLLGIGVPMTEYKITERYNAYKTIVGFEIAFIGIAIIVASLLVMFPNLIPLLLR